MIRPTLPVAMSAAGANLLGAIVQYRVVAGWKKQGNLPCCCCFASITQTMIPLRRRVVPCLATDAAV